MMVSILSTGLQCKKRVILDGFRGMMLTNVVCLLKTATFRCKQIVFTSVDGEKTFDYQKIHFFQRNLRLRFLALNYHLFFFVMISTDFSLILNKRFFLKIIYFQFQLNIINFLVTGL